MDFTIVDGLSAVVTLFLLILCVLAVYYLSQIRSYLGVLRKSQENTAMLLAQIKQLLERGKV